MPATVQELLPRLAKLVKAQTPRDDTELLEDLAAAAALLEDHIGDAPVPDLIRDRATLTVAGDLWAARKAPNGISVQQFQGADGGLGNAPLRISRDPLAGVGKLLSKWVIGL